MTEVNSKIMNESTKPVCYCVVNVCKHNALSLNGILCIRSSYWQVFVVRLDHCLAVNGLRILDEHVFMIRMSKRHGA